METCPRRNWICSNSPPAAWHKRAQLRRRSCGANFSSPIRFAESFTMCQTAVALNGSGNGYPILLIRRKIFPRSMPAAVSQLSSSFRTQSGIGTVRHDRPYQPCQRWPSSLLSSADRPPSAQPLHASEDRRQVTGIARGFQR